MSRALAEHILFKPKSSKAETKADITDSAARSIIGDEAARREAKTARLRQARIDNEAKLAAIPDPRQKKAKTTKQPAALSR